MHQSKESSPVDFRKLISLSKPNLCMDLSHQNVLDAIPETLARIEKYLEKKPYVHQLDLTGSGFKENLASLEHLALHLEVQPNVVYFLAQLPPNITSIKLRDFTVPLDMVWAIHIFCELQSYAKKLDEKKYDWLQHINQWVWQNQNALVLIDQNYLPEHLSSNCMLLLEKICLNKGSAFGFLCASWLNKGLIVKSFFDPNPYIAKFYYQQAKALYQNDQYFNFNLPKESELKTSCWIKHGYCVSLQTFDDLSHFKRILRKLQPMEILVTDIQTLELVELMQKMFNNIKIPITLIITGPKAHRTKLYEKLLPYVKSEVALYLPGDLSKTDALAICHHSHPNTHLELSPNLDLELASYLLTSLPRETKIAPCSILDLERVVFPIVQELQEHDLICLPINLSPYQNICVSDVAHLLLTRLPFLQHAHVLKLPYYLTADEMEQLLPTIHTEHTISIDAYTPAPVLLKWLEKGFKLRLEASFTNQQMEWLLSFNKPIQFEFSNTCSTALIASICQQLIDDCVISINPYHSSTQLFDIAHQIPNGVTVDIPNQLNPSLAEYLMQNLPLSTEIITAPNCEERLMQAIASGRQSRFDQSSIIIHSIYRPSGDSDTKPKTETFGSHL